MAGPIWGLWLSGEYDRRGRPMIDGEQGRHIKFFGTKREALACQEGMIGMDSPGIDGRTLHLRRIGSQKKGSVVRYPFPLEITVVRSWEITSEWKDGKHIVDMNLTH